MILNGNSFFKKRKYLIGLILVLFISVICVAFSMDHSNDFDISRREILLRRIGHELLLQSGDSISRVLPVKRIAENEYQVSFEHELSFKPELLVNTTRRLLAKDPLASDYVVNVLKCDSPGTAYGFAVSKSKKDDIITCVGRTQPKACYMINIKFKQTETGMAKTGYILAGLPLLAFVGFLFIRSRKPQSVLPNLQTGSLPINQAADPITVQDNTGKYSLGSILFDAKSKQLFMNGQVIDLTGTETRVLLIFASAPNEVIERSRLQKEIWEDQGVIVGRSLDMFISKLRKKLEIDPTIKISVIRSKGYKLEISA